jgi:hypothetical protein
LWGGRLPEFVGEIEAVHCRLSIVICPPPLTVYVPTQLNGSAGPKPKPNGIFPCVRKEWS